MLGNDEAEIADFPHNKCRLKRTRKSVLRPSIAWICDMNMPKLILGTNIACKRLLFYHKARSITKLCPKFRFLGLQSFNYHSFVPQTLDTASGYPSKKIWIAHA